MVYFKGHMRRAGSNVMFCLFQAADLQRGSQQQLHLYFLKTPCGFGFGALLIQESRAVLKGELNSTSPLINNGRPKLAPAAEYPDGIFFRYTIKELIQMDRNRMGRTDCKEENQFEDRSGGQRYNREAWWLQTPSANNYYLQVPV